MTHDAIVAAHHRIAPFVRETPVEDSAALAPDSGASVLLKLGLLQLAARRAANDSGRVFISPYNDADVIAGQGTIAVELHNAAPAIDAVFVAVGGGGLIGGIGAYLKAVSPRTEIAGCWPETSPVMLR